MDGASRRHRVFYIKASSQGRRMDQLSGLFGDSFQFVGLFGLTGSSRIANIVGLCFGIKARMLKEAQSKLQESESVELRIQQAQMRSQISAEFQSVLVKLEMVHALGSSRLICLIYH